jgi:peptidoglycan L-alanyl-D-glutamate endopeptidase CwlK
MPSFGKRSRANLDTAHESLQKLFDEVVKEYDCAVIEGHRNQERQDRLFFEGKSKLKFPNGKHNKVPSLAVDVVPYPIDWSDKVRFYHFAGYVKGVASQLGIKVRWGGDWDSDNDLNDQTFFDLPHFELIL